jgi:hypothetical protein
MLLLYTEKQLHTAYKKYIISSFPPYPSIEDFREMFEKSEELQALATEEVAEH